MSVYFAQVGHYIKVGFSNDPERRVANLWRGSTRYGRPNDLSTSAPRSLLLAIPGDLEEERVCHRALADYAAGCEFFIDEPGVREFMAHAERGEFPKMARPGGEYVPDYDHMPAERLEEIERLVARAREKHARKRSA